MSAPEQTAHTGRTETGTAFPRVATKADLDTLDQADILEGYMSAERGDPEPGANRGRAFWHGWRNRMVDIGVLPVDAASIQLVRELLADERAKRAARSPAPPFAGDGP
jgi:hypothetical protein